MTTGTSTEMGTGQHTRMLTAMFDSREDADEAIERLVKLGVPRSNCRLVEGESSSTSSTVSAQGHREPKGFWDSLADLFMPDEDRYTYAEGLRRGGYLVTVNVTEAQFDKALDILDDEGTIDLEERSQAWRKEGWSESDYQSLPGYQGTPSGQTDFERTAGSQQATSRQANLRQAASQPSTAQTKGTTAGEESIPIVEEQLRVGKREVGGGRVRVRSYVVEQPVQEQVSLRDEHVTVERRAVDPSRPLGAGEDAFRERTIEADERREEAVVNKEARVKEEVVVRKDAQQRTETVSDKVRRTEVEIDDQTKSNPGSRKGDREAG